MAEAVVSVSDDLADDLARVARIPRSRITVIHNPIVTEELLAAARAPVEHPWFARGRAAGAARGGPADGAEGLPDAAAGVPGRARAARAAPGGARRGRGARGAWRRSRGSSESPPRWTSRASWPTRTRSWPGRRCSCSRPRGRACRRSWSRRWRAGRRWSPPTARAARGRSWSGGATGAWWRWATTGRWPGRSWPRSTIRPRRSCCGERAGDFGTDQAIERYRAVLEV